MFLPNITDPTKENKMFSLIAKLALWILSIWTNLPDRVKEIIIDNIVNTFEAIFRAFYRHQKRQEDSP